VGAQNRFREGRAFIRLGLITSLFLSAAFCVSAQNVTNAIRAFLQQRLEVQKREEAVVVGLIDERGSAVVSCGKMDNGSDRDVTADTIFEIGSVTKTFTALLLADMVERGEMKLDDPVQKYLTDSVHMPTRNGKEITLVQLATHTSGLPGASVTWIPKRAENPRAEYTVAKLFQFATRCKLTRDPGTKYEYSTAGIALLGEAIARKSGINYEKLVRDRICRPLAMESTYMTVPPQLTNRTATGHNFYGYAVPPTYWGALSPGAGLKSTANDLLKYLAAQLGLTRSPLASALEKSHAVQFKAGNNTDLAVDTDIALSWMITREPDGTPIIRHAGLTDGFMADVRFDIKHHRGLVVLWNSMDVDLHKLAGLLITNDWQSSEPIKLHSDSAAPRLRVAVQVDEKLLQSVIGDYEFKSSQVFPTGVKLKIRPGTNMLIGEATGENTPQGAFEIFAESKTNFFLKINGAQLVLKKDSSEKVTGIIYRTYRGKQSEGTKIAAP
jgi:D-alanyl-D-alanine-carboxypeptidase/D-alanyl-D-alanine-endopeptidase